MYIYVYIFKKCKHLVDDLHYNVKEFFQWLLLILYDLINQKFADFFTI